MSLRTLLYNPRLPSPPAVEEGKKSSSNEVELSEMRENSRKQQERWAKKKRVVPKIDEFCYRNEKNK